MSEDRLKNPEKYYLSHMKPPNSRKKRFLSFDSDSILSYFPKSFSLSSFDAGFSDHVNCMNGMVKLHSALSQSTNSFAKNYLSMSMSDKNDLYCAPLHCKVGPLNPDESAIIRLRFRLWSRNLALVSDLKFTFTV
jgi:hypothetical protein